MTGTKVRTTDKYNGEVVAGLPKIFWIDQKGEVLSGDTHTNLVLQRGQPDVLGLTAREYAIERWNWVRCRKETNARGGYVVEVWEHTPSTRRRLENVFEVGQVVELESLKNKKMKTIVL